MKSTHPVLQLIGLTLLGGLSGCATEPYDDDRQPGPRPYYDNRYSAWDYYYYPGIAVYFHITTGDYYYRDHGRWIRTRHLPPHIHMDRESYRHLIIRDAHPYDRHEDHERLYGPRHDKTPEAGREFERRPTDRRDSGRERDDRDQDRREERGPDRPHPAAPGAADNRSAGDRDEARANRPPDRHDDRDPHDAAPDTRKPAQDKTRDGRGERRQDDRDDLPQGKWQGDEGRGPR